MAADDIAALAERVERATGPDRELDIDICTRALNKSRLDPGFQTAPRFTASLDAAMSLVPEGYPQISKVSADAWQVNIGFANRAKGIVTRAATPALALCAASLLARAALTTKDSDHG